MRAKKFKKTTTKNGESVPQIFIHLQSIFKYLKSEYVSLNKHVEIKTFLKILIFAELKVVNSHKYKHIHMHNYSHLKKR